MAKKESFERLLEETEELVAQLESGELSLDQSLKRYEKGVENLRSCAKLLSTAEEKVKILIESTEGIFSLEEFDEGEQPFTVEEPRIDTNRHE